jgi:hypothetical protein
MIEQLLWKFLQIVTMLNPLRINSGPSGQKNETGVGESSKEPLMKGYFFKQKYFIIIDNVKNRESRFL